MKIIKKLFLLLFLLFLAGLLVAFGYYLSVTRKVELDPNKLVFQEQSVLIYDGTDTPVHSGITGSFKQTTSIRDIPLHVQRAFVDTEDKRFYSHRGCDMKRIVGATLHNAKARSFKEGASTISQQLIKNTHLSQEKTIKRKLQEWKLTRALEKRYTKDEILQRYLNTIYFGHGCFGITSAAEYYFGKTPSELSLADGAILAGLVKSPNHYSPFKNAEACKRRKAIVLAAMEKNGSVTAQERAQANAHPLPLSSPTKKEGGYLSFVFDELTSLAEEYGFRVGGKMEIHTYLDPKLQTQIEEIAKSYDQSDKTLLVLDSEKKGFKGCVSTLGNRPRLPGSLIKPLLVYAPAIEEDILSPATPILDEKINYGGYSPENYDGKYHGYVSARECVEKSLNIPAVKILESLTVEKGAAYLRKLRLEVKKEDKSLALALGGMQEGYTLKELISAYASLADGLTEPCSFISSVKIDGISVYQRKGNPTRVFSEETAYLTTDILKGTAIRGTAKKLRTLPFEIAAKTGTVGTKNGNTDAYALAYTTRDVAAVWLGNADNREIDCTGGGTPCNLLYQMEQALHELYQSQSQPIASFPACEKVKSVNLDKTSYYDTHNILLADENSPPSARFSELFKSSAIPLNKSTSYSKPSIIPPQLHVENGKVIIQFEGNYPTYYTYQIDRYDYATHTTIYKGEYLPSFIDDTIEEGKNYAYTVTPLYGDNAGTPISLPTVTTKKGTPLPNEEIDLPKEWWKQ